jgi:hypothetical protein
VKLQQHLVKSGRFTNVRNTQQKYVAKVHTTIAQQSTCLSDLLRLVAVYEMTGVATEQIMYRQKHP